MWDIPESWYGEEESVVDAVPEIVSSPTTNFQNYIKNTANTALKPIGTFAVVEKILILNAYFSVRRCNRQYLAQHERTSTNNS